MFFQENVSMFGNYGQNLSGFNKKPEIGILVPVISAFVSGMESGMRCRIPGLTPLAYMCVCGCESG